MADALDSGSSGGNTVRVQVPFSALASGARKPCKSRLLAFFITHLSLITFDYHFVYI